MLFLCVRRNRSCESVLRSDDDGDCMLTLYAGETLDFAGNRGASVRQFALVEGGARLTVVFDLKPAAIPSLLESATDIARMGAGEGVTMTVAVIRPGAVDCEIAEACDTEIREAIEAFHERSD
jgi:hypothetical protein